MSAEPMNTGVPLRSLNGASPVRSTPGNGGPGTLKGMRYPEGGIGGRATVVVTVVEVEGV